MGSGVWFLFMLSRDPKDLRAGQQHLGLLASPGLAEPWGHIGLSIWLSLCIPSDKSWHCLLSSSLLSLVCWEGFSLLRVAVKKAVSHVLGLLFLHRQAELQLGGVDPGRNQSTFWILRCHLPCSLLGCSVQTTYKVSWIRDKSRPMERAGRLKCVVLWTVTKA